jgi:hypothetical protein
MIDTENDCFQSRERGGQNTLELQLRSAPSGGPSAALDMGCSAVC